MSQSSIYGSVPFTLGDHECPFCRCSGPKADALATRLRQSLEEAVSQPGMTLAEFEAWLESV